MTTSRRILPILFTGQRLIGGFRIAEHHQSTGREPRKPQHERPPTGAGEPMLRRLANNFAAVAIRQQQPRIVRQHLDREIRRDREQQSVAPLPVFRPFAIGAKILERRLDLDDPDLALVVDRHQVRPAAVARLTSGKLLKPRNASVRVAPRAISRALSDCRPSTRPSCGPLTDFTTSSSLCWRWRYLS